MTPPATTATLLRDELLPDQRPLAGRRDRAGLAARLSGLIAGPVSAIAVDEACARVIR